MGAMAERLARRPSQHVDVVARYGVRFITVEKKGRMRLCYDGAAYRKLLSMRATEEQRARAMLALSDQERAEWKKFGRSEAEYDRMMDEMLYERNASWIEPIERLHAAGGGFIAVGAMHLVGQRSVLDLLRQRGYKVTRLTP